MEKILPFTVYVIALCKLNDPTHLTETWAIDCDAADIGFFLSLKDSVTADGKWEFRGYIIQKSETVFRSNTHRHFSSIGHFIENIGGILVSLDTEA